jgi:uncharacterized protein (TIGR02246 family)
MLLAAVVCWLWMAALVQGPVGPDAERDVRQLAESVDAALQARDGGALESLIADGFEFVHSTGRVEDRASFIRRATAGQLASQRTPGERLELRYRVFGDTVIGTTLTAVRLPGADAASDPMRIYTRNVYARIDGRWRWASSQSTTAQTAPTGAAIR